MGRLLDNGTVLLPTRIRGMSMKYGWDTALEYSTARREQKVFGSSIARRCSFCYFARWLLVPQDSIALRRGDELQEEVKKRSTLISLWWI